MRRTALDLLPFALSAVFLLLWVIAPKLAAAQQPISAVQETDWKYSVAERAVSFSPDGSLLASASVYVDFFLGVQDGAISLWNSSDGSLVWRLKGFGSGVSSVSFSPDGKMIASGGDYEGLFAFGGSGSIKLWRVSDGKPIRTLRGHTSPVNSVAFSPDGRIIASGSWDETIKLWRVSDGSLIRTINVESAVHSVTFSPDGSMLAAGCGDPLAFWADGAACLYRVSDGKLIHKLPQGYVVTTVAFSPEGKLIVAGGISSDNTIKLWRVSDGKLIHTLKGHTASVNSVAFSPDGSMIASGSGALWFDNAVKLWRVSDGLLISTLDVRSAVRSVAFSPDGRVLAYGLDNGTVGVLRVPLPEKPPSYKPVAALRGDADGDGKITILDAMITLHCALGLSEPRREEVYSIHGADHDFICVRKEILASKQDGTPEIEHVQMSPSAHQDIWEGNSVGYIDVGLNDEDGRKVRLFYVHFPSPQIRWSLGVPVALYFGQAHHEAHVDGFTWIATHAIRADGLGMPSLMAGDFNNDFIRRRTGLQYWSGQSIYEQVDKLDLWIFNPPPDGGLKEDYYEPTWRLEQLGKMTIDWVMGKWVSPLPSELLETSISSFSTSPPDWWKDSGWSTFDHKPLYGGVVFNWRDKSGSVVHTSRPYYVLSANVGNANLMDLERLYKLRPFSEEEAKVRSGVQSLKPDIVILIELNDMEQALRICGEVLGDMDGNGWIDLNDVMLIMRAALGI